jgi:hypothetical protein
MLYAGKFLFTSNILHIIYVLILQSFVELPTLKIVGYLLTVRKKSHVVIGASSRPVHARPVTDEVAVEHAYLLR